MRIGFRTRIYPTEEQSKTLDYYAYTSHKLWNFVVAKYKDCEQLPLFTNVGIKNYSQRDLMDEFGVNDIPERIALDVLKRYSEAWLKHFKYPNLFGKPKSHKYNPRKLSFCITSRDFSIDRNNTIKMPNLIFEAPNAKKYRMPINTKFLSKHGIKVITEPCFIRYEFKWYIVGSSEIPDPIKSEDAEWLGLDWGIKNFYTTSNEEFINYPNSVKRQFYRISKLQSYYDKKQKGSANHKKLKIKLDKAYARLEGLKRDFIEQTTTRLCRTNNIAVEDLTNAEIRISDKDRRRLQQIAPITRFTEKLRWKCEKFGTEFAMVNPAYTTRTCSECKHINPKLDESVRIFVCAKCGLVLDRDINAAINIKLIAATGVCCSAHKPKVV